MNDFAQSVQAIAAFAIPVLFAIALHEAAHGYVARYFGDDTAERAGRLSLNPARHIDPFGTILLPLLLYFTIKVPFGYAKPVPVDFSRLRNPKKQMAFVAAAGPLANFVQCFAWGAVLVTLRGTGVEEPFFYAVGRAGLLANAAMCVFNLIPVPPLDGGRIVTSLLPMELARKYARIELYTPLVFIGLTALVWAGLLDSVLIFGMNLVMNVVQVLLTPLQLLFA